MAGSVSSMFSSTAIFLPLLYQEGKMVFSRHSLACIVFFNKCLLDILEINVYFSFFQDSCRLLWRTFLVSNFSFLNVMKLSLEVTCERYSRHYFVFSQQLENRHSTKICVYWEKNTKMFFWIGISAAWKILCVILVTDLDF